MYAVVLAARRGTADPWVLFWILAGIALICAVAWWFGKEQRLKRTLRRTPVRSISELAATEPGRVVGTAQPLGKTLVAPLSGRTCVYYRAEVWERRGKHWRSIICEARGVAFAIHDGVGRAQVDPNHAEVVIDRDAHGRSGMFDDAEPAEKAFLRRHGQGSEGLILNRSLRYHEAVIEVGERIAVLGCLRHEPDPEASQAESPPAAPRLPWLTGSLEGRLVISDSRETTEP